jgi:hypothetical protein
MFKLTNLSKQLVLVALVLAVVLAAFPFGAASAATLNDPTTPPTTKPDNSRLESLWAREQTTYQRQTDRLAKASELVTKVQTLIDKANAKGWDTSAVQAALDAFSAAIPAAQSAHTPGAAILSSHAGFDASGKVTDRTTAIQTVKSLAQVLKETRTAMDGTGKALREALKALRAAHPKPTPTTTTP